MKKDIRWIQRYRNYGKALDQLKRFIQKENLNELEEQGLIQNGDIWMDMIQNRNLTSHAYNQDTAQEIIRNIRTHYYQEFLTLFETFELLTKKEAA